MKKTITFFLCCMLFMRMDAGAQSYSIVSAPNGGLPPGGYVTSYNTTSGTLLMTGPQSANSWSSVQTLPFPFYFYGNLVTQFKVSGNGVLTFDVNSSILPGANTTIPTSSLPDSSIAFLWDDFSATSSGDAVRTQTFGSSPNRQQWIWYYSYKIGNPAVSFAYFALVLEESTNNIYIVDHYNGTPLTSGTTVGVQLNATNGVMDILSPSVMRGSNSTGTTDDDLWTLTPIIPCTTPPNPGSVVASNVTPCPNSAFLLYLQNNSIGIGQSYDWEMSAMAPNSFTSVSGSLSAPTYSATAPLSPGVYYFRCKVDCNSNVAYSDTITITVPSQLPGNTYTINAAAPSSSTNFQSFTEASNYIRCGITGPIVINVSSGTYLYDHFWLDSINTNATNTITVNGGGATLIDTATTTDYAVVRLNNTSYVTINNLNIIASGSIAGFGMSITANSDYNTISNCLIQTDSTSTSANFCGIAISGSATDQGSTGSDCDYNTITGNTIIGGSYGLSLVGSTTADVMGNIISNNQFRNFYSRGISINYADGTVIESNDLTRPGRTNSTTTYGFYLSNCQTTSISKNKIHNLFDSYLTSASTCYPIYLTVSDAPIGNENIFSNNLIYNINNNQGTIYGIYNNGSDNAKYYHNTVVLDDQTVTTDEDSRGFYETGTVTGLELANNIFYVTRTAIGTTADAGNYGIFLNTATSFVSNNNNFFISGAARNHVGQDGSGNDWLTLLDWQTNTSQDGASLSVNPTFNNSASGDYTPFNAGLDNMGVPVAGISTDILNAPRNASTPDIGAYEFNVPVCNPSGLIAGTSSASPQLLCAGGSVTFDLIGSSTGAGISFTWQSAPTATGPFTTVSASSNASTFITNVFTSEYYRCEIACGSTTLYSDTIFVNAIQPLAGNYTVNSGAATSATNFQSFADLISALNCGVAGPVVVDVVPGSGPYNERIEFPIGMATSATNTLRINGHGNWLMHSTSTSALRAAILMDGHDYITIDSLNIDVRGGTYGYGIHLINDADNDTISNCTIITDTSSTSSNFMGICLSGSATSYSTAGDNNNTVIDGNTIIGGYYGIMSYGSSSEIAMNNIIRNNTIQETHYDGIYLYYSSNFTISGNDISRPQRSSQVACAGISLSTCSGGGFIDANKIHNLRGGDPTSTIDCYGIELSSSDGTSTTPFIVSNNLIYNMTGNGDIYGLYNSGSDYAQYYFNTISLDETSSSATVTTKGFYQTTTATGIEFKNNIITITRGGTGVKTGVHFNTAATVTNGVVVDNNVYYINSAAGTNNIGGQASSYSTTLAAWQTSFSPAQDLASVEIDPLYTNMTTHDYTPTRMAVNDIGLPIPTVLTDINGVVRSISNPDPGAYEWAPPPCVTPPTAGIVFVDNDTLCLGSTVTLSLTGNSSGSGQTYVWESAPSLAGPYTAVNPTPGVSSLYSFAPTASAYYRAAVTCNANTAYSDTVFIMVRTPMAGNTYTVDPSLPASSTNFLSLQEAVDAMSCGITGPVVINVASGSSPYLDQQLVFPPTLVTSSTNTITINGNGATLVSNCQDANQRAAVAFYGTDYVTINDLVIDASTGAYNWGIFFTQGADYNKIANCTIISSKTATSSAIAGGIVFSASNTAAAGQGNNGNFDTFINNTIIGGYYGLAIYGASATPSQGHVIANNISQDAYVYNILVVYNDGTVIRGNDVSRPTRTNTGTFAGIYVNSPSTNVVVENNKIHNIADNISSTSTAYGIWFGTADGTSTAPNIARNNIIYNMNSQGTQYGIYNSGSDYSYIYNNSISLDDNSYTGSSNTVGFYQTTLASGIDLKNNIIKVTRTTTGTNIGIHINTTTTTFTSDYNDVYVAAATTNEFGRIGTTTSGTAYPTISSWKTALTQDMSSDSLNPYYTNTLIGDLTPTNPLLDNRGTPLAMVATDILNNMRNAVTPDMGAYEFAAPLCPPPAQVSATNIHSTTADISWAYVNNAAPSLGYEYYYSTGSATPASNVTPSGFGSTGNTANLSGLTGGTLYYVWVRSICSAADTSAWSQPATLRTRPVNDSAINATLLTVGTTVCNGINYNGDVGGATLELNEPTISCEQTVGTSTSVWYKFDAPASGMVRISTDHAVSSAYDSLIDSKIGVYSVTDSSDFTTYQIVGCDEDNGVVSDGYRSVVYLADLTPNSRYYIKVDKNNPANPDAAFCIDVMPMTSSMISSNDNCGGTGYMNNGADLHNGQQAWVSKVDDMGLLIYNMKTNTNSALGDMPDKFYEHTGTARTYNGTPYLNRNYEITAQNAPTAPITLQFFFTDADFLALQTAKPGITMADLHVTRLSTATCSDTFNPTGHTASLLTQLANGAGTNGVRYINVSTPGFSSFFIHADNYPLLIRLQNITAVNRGDHNQIDWNTSSEETGDRFELERSLDGKVFTKIAAIQAKGEATHYSYLDKDARNGVNYYRLKMYDLADRFEYSAIVKATVNGKGNFAIDAYPNPVNGNLTVSASGIQGANAQVMILDVTGKLIRKVQMNGNAETINMSSLASGVYLIKYTDDLHSETIRVTKE